MDLFLETNIMEKDSVTLTVERDIYSTSMSADRLYYQGYLHSPGKDVNSEGIASLYILRSDYDVLSDAEKEEAEQTMYRLIGDALLTLKWGKVTR